MDMVAGSLHLWVTLALLAAALVLYANEKLPLEVVSVGSLGIMLLLFQLAPLRDAQGHNLLSPEVLLSGFGNSALITIMALLVLGDSLTRTGALDQLGAVLARFRLPPMVTVALALVTVAAVSGFINDTPVVVMFLPVLQALTLRLGLAPSRVMMPLSFAAILGGMTTLIGSSTNLLVSSVMVSQGMPGLGFFDQTPVGLVLAAAGVVYVVLVMPRLLPDRGGLKLGVEGNGKQFVSQIPVAAGSPLDGAAAVAGCFRELPDITVHLILRGEAVEFPPYDAVVLAPGDVLVVAGTRKALADTAARHPGLLTLLEAEADAFGEDADDEDEAAQTLRRAEPRHGSGVLAEAMVPPTSRFTGFTLDQLGLKRNFGLTVLGIERRARMMRNPMSDIRLQAGDVLLLHGHWEDVDQLRADRDLVVVSGTAAALPTVRHARVAIAAFVAAVAASAFGVLPIVVSSLLAAAVVVGAGALTPRQAIRAIDHKVVLLVGNALALGVAMEETGAAAFLAHHALALIGGAGPWGALMVYFGLVAAVTNVLSNNATAVLFTPIALGLAKALGMDPTIFAVATILASNCSFATPIGYQTNLLVMGPGHYRFADYIKAGLPLILVLWAAFGVAAKLVWGL